MKTKIRKIIISELLRKWLPWTILCFAVFFPVASVKADDITAAKIIELVNAERLLNGLDIVKESDLLNKAAKFKLKDMIENDYFAHTSPAGMTPWSWFEKSGYDYKYAGENLAINFSSARSQHKAWMASPTHRKNILNPRYREIGIAIGEGKIDGKESIVTVQMFGTLMAVAQSKNNEKASETSKETVAEVSGQEKALKTFLPDVKESTSPILQPAKPSDQWLGNERIDIARPVCENGTCYFNEANHILSSREKMANKLAWAVVVLTLFISVIINALTLSRGQRYNPFIASNTAALILVLVTMILWQI